MRWLDSDSVHAYICPMTRKTPTSPAKTTPASPATAKTQPEPMPSTAEKQPPEKRKENTRRKQPAREIPPRSLDDALSPLDELFVELYFQFAFDARLAYARSIGHAVATSTIASQAYKLLAQPPIQAAIQRRRAALRVNVRATLDEKLGILEGIMRDPSVTPKERISAIYLHSRHTGEIDREGRGTDPFQAGPSLHQICTPAALRALPVADLIAKINRGLLPQSTLHVIDVQAQFQAAPDAPPPPSNGNGNGNGKHN